MRNLARMQQILDRMAQPGIAQAAWCKERDDFYRELLNELWRRDQEIMRLIDRMRAFLLDMLKQQERERETKEWQESWERYGERWEELKKSGGKGNPQQLREIIPWPVKSHQYKDVTEDSIKLFLTKAPPADYDYSKKLALFNAECLKWHADRIPRLFGSIDDPSLTTFFHIVSQVAIKMRAEVAREQK